MENDSISGRTFAKKLVQAMLVNPGGVAISHFSQPLSSTNEQYVRNSILNESTNFFFFCDQELLSFC